MPELSRHLRNVLRRRTRLKAEVSQIQIRTLVGLLIAVHLAAALSLTPWHLPATSDKLSSRVTLMAIGAILVQPALLALWAALSTQSFKRRIAQSLAVLACVYLAEDFASAKNSRNGGDAGEILQPIAWLVCFLVCQIPLWFLRRRFGWQIEAQVASDEMGASKNQFSLLELLAATGAVAAFLAALRWIHPATGNSDWGKFLLIFPAMGTFMSLPGMLVPIVCWIVLPPAWRGRWQLLIAIGGLSAVVAAAVAVARYGSPGEVGELVFVLLGALVSAGGSLLVIRACGFQLVRKTVHSATQPTAVHASAPAARSRWPFFLAASSLVAILAAIAALTPARLKLWREIRVARDWSEMGLSPVLVDGQPLRLVTINGADTRIDAAAIARINACNQLRELDLLGASVTDDTLEQLAALPSLTKLSLLSARINDDGIRHLGKFRNLSELDLCMTDVTDEGLTALAGLRKLSKVDLEHTRVTAEGVGWLRQTKPDLQARTTTDDTSLRRIATFFQRRQSRLSRDGVSLPSLRLPAIGPGVTDAGVALLRGMTQIEELDLTDAQVTDKSITNLATLTGLKKLTLRGTQVTDSGVEKLRLALPNCEITAYNEAR
jgi:hypothetical protein